MRDHRLFRLDPARSRTEAAIAAMLVLPLAVAGAVVEGPVERLLAAIERVRGRRAARRSL